MSKKFLPAFGAAFITMFLLAFAWHQPIMGEFYANNPGAAGSVARAEPIVWMIAVGYVVLALLMAYIYPKGVEGGSTLMEGFKFGALIGLLWVLPHSIVMYGVQMVDSKILVIVDGLWHVLEQGLGGIVIAYIYAMGTSTESTPDASTN